MMEDNIDDPSIDEVLSGFMDGALKAINTAIPGFVVAWDKDTQLATIQPVFNSVVENFDGEEMEKEKPLIENVPCYGFRGGGFFVSFPLKAGDLVLVITCQRSTDDYLETDGKTKIKSGNTRAFDLSDSFAIPFPVTKKNKISNASATDLVIGLENADAEIHLTPNAEFQFKGSAIRLGSLTANKALALATETSARLDAIQNTYNAHTHVVTGLGVPTVTPIALITGSNNVASTKVFTNG